MPEEPAFTPSVLGANIKRLRNQRGYSQTKLAKLGGMYSKAHLCRLERGKQKGVRYETVIKLAKALRVPAEKLVEAPKEEAATITPSTEELLS